MNSNQKGPDLNGLRKAIDRRWNRSQAKQLASIQIEINNFLAKSKILEPKSDIFSKPFQRKHVHRFSISGHSAWQEETETFFSSYSNSSLALKHCFRLYRHQERSKIGTKTSNMIRRFKPTALGYLLGTRLQGPT